MGQETHSFPKGLLNIGDKSIVSNTIEQLHSVGVFEIAMVIGYKGSIYRERFPGITFIENDSWEENNSVSSLLCAIDWIDQEVIVLYSDIFISPELLRLTIQISGEDWVIPSNKNFLLHWNHRYPMVAPSMIWRVSNLIVIII